MRNIIGIILFCLSGFFIYTINLLAFTNLPGKPTTTFSLIGVYLTLAIICHSIGLVTYRGYNWRYITALTVLIALSANLFTIMTVFFVIDSGTTIYNTDLKGLNLFTDYLTGFTVTTVFMVIGIYLYFESKKHINTESKNKA